MERGSPPPSPPGAGDPPPAAQNGGVQQDAPAQPDEQSPLLAQLLERLAHLGANANNEDLVVDPNQARYLLEATGGHVETAVGLFLEDRVAYQAVQRGRREEQGNQNGNRDRDRDRNNSRNRNNGNRSGNRAVRPQLEAQPPVDHAQLVRQLAQPPPLPVAPQQPQPRNEAGGPPPVQLHDPPLPDRPGALVVQDEPNHPINNNNPAAAQVQVRPAVSSDDEPERLPTRSARKRKSSSGGRRRTKRVRWRLREAAAAAAGGYDELEDLLRERRDSQGRVAAAAAAPTSGDTVPEERSWNNFLSRHGDRARNRGERHVRHSRSGWGARRGGKKRTKQEGTESDSSFEGGEEDDEEDFFSESDFDPREDAEDNTAVNVSPSDVLWNPRRPRSSEESSDDVVEDPKDTAGASAANLNDVPAGSGEDPSEQHTKVGQIPRTWLSAGFTLSSCGTGIKLRPPDTTEVARLQSLQSELYPQNSRHAAIPPPLPTYHCAGITALTSLVTALLYTGASIQGNEVNCNSNRTFFGDLKDEERKVEFPNRLADALSSILFVAAKEEADRKLRTLAKLDEKLLKRKQRHKERRRYQEEDLEEVDVEEDAASKDRTTQMRQKMILRSKLTPVCRWDEHNAELRVPLDQLIDRSEELRFKVSLTNLKDMKAYVLSNLSSFMSRGGCALFMESLLHIRGKIRTIRQFRKFQDSSSNMKFGSIVECNCVKRQKAMWRKAMESPLSKKDWSAPPGLDCVALSNLLQMVYHLEPDKIGMKLADNFGLGILSTVHSMNKSSEPYSHMFTPKRQVWIVRGVTSYSVLWNGAGTNQMCNPASENDLVSFSLTHWNSWYNGRNKTEFRVIPQGRAVNRLEGTSTSSAVTEEEIKNTRSNNNDEKLYPGNFSRWRFTFGDSDDECDIPFYRLDKRQREIVKMKLAPRVNLAVWENWPGATIDNFVPADSPPTV